jgi:hypothetical protein
MIIICVLFSFFFFSFLVLGRPLHVKTARQPLVGFVFAPTAAPYEPVTISQQKTKQKQQEQKNNETSSSFHWILCRRVSQSSLGP